LSEAESHHALHVVRVRPGERIVVLDGADHEYLCEVGGILNSRLTLAVRQRNILPGLPWQITLIQAVTKAKSLELIFQKATELGAERIIPIISERSVPQFAEADMAKKAGKWQDITIEAMKQCGCPRLPKVEPPLPLVALLGRGERFDLALLSSLQPGSRHPRDYFQAFHAEQQRWPERIAVWVGPEGDFTPAELNAIKAGGALPITLGPLVLRSETAAMYCLSVLNYELQAHRT
jgi:16S rRNA (uracil1498-N3)-methyltransferase